MSQGRRSNSPYTQLKYPVSADAPIARMTRREVLRGVGGMSLALPLLTSLPRVYAQDGMNSSNEPPKRLLLFYTPNGTKKELWRPSHEAGLLSDVGPLLTPLTPFLDHLNLFDGVDLSAALEGPGGPHQRGMASLFTGAVISEGEFVGGDGRKAGWAGGISIDQLIAQHIGQESPFKSLELGVRVRENMPRGRISYAGANQPLPPENDPLMVYQRIFGSMNEPAVVVQRRLRRRTSVLDHVLGNFNALERKVDAADREKLQRHAENVRELERRLSLLGGSGGGLCQPIEPTFRSELFAETEYEAIAKSQIDLIVQAFACDQTRVASLQCSTAVNALRFSFLDPAVENEGHSLSHSGDTNASLQGEWERTLTWYSSLFAYLLSKLSEIPEGNGSLLDHTVILWGNELSRGNTHQLTDIPFILAGGGLIPSGRYLKYESVAHNQLLLGIIQAFGVEADQFGAPHLNAGVLDGLLG